jgi:hypothetical protein
MLKQVGISHSDFSSFLYTTAAQIGSRVVLHFALTLKHFLLRGTAA